MILQALHDIIPGLPRSGQACMACRACKGTTASMLSISLTSCLHCMVPGEGARDMDWCLQDL